MGAHVIHGNILRRRWDAIAALYPPPAGSTEPGAPSEMTQQEMQDLADEIGHRGDGMTMTNNTIRWNLCHTIRYLDMSAAERQERNLLPLMCWDEYLRQYHADGRPEIASDGRPIE